MKKKFGLLIFVIAVLVSGCNKDPFADANSGTFKDTRDSHSYKWVRINNQIWMAENLAWLPAVNPAADGSESIAYYYVYNYQGTSITDAKASANYATYGALYNWPAGQTACPSGWHLPSDAEWTVLTDYLGGISVAAPKMKSTSGWNANGNGNNSSGFNALPCGGRDHHGFFATINYLAVFTSATESSATTAWYRGLIYNQDNVLVNDPVKSDGYSVRCLRN